jgi:P-type Ca2+ transporter type 2C
MIRTADLSAIGLTAEAAADRLAAEGPNAVAAPPPRRLLAQVGRQLADGSTC